IFDPLAHQKRIRLSPCLPAAWDWARLDAVRVGDQRLDLAVAVDRTAGEVRVEIHGLDPDWTVDVEIAPAWYGLPAGRYVLEVNGEVRVSGGSGPLSANWRSRGRDYIALKPAEKGGAARGWPGEPRRGVRQARGHPERRGQSGQQLHHHRQPGARRLSRRP